MWTTKYEELQGGPVRVVSTNGQAIFASQRVLWDGALDFNEVIGVPDSNTATTWWFPWYSSIGETHNWVLVGNPGPNPAYVEIYIGENKISDSPHTVPAGDVWTAEYDDLQDGPVQVVSINNQDIFASQRVLWRGTSDFNEMMGMPQSSGMFLHRLYLPIVLHAN